jgi:nucleoporin p58/p45
MTTTTQPQSSGLFGSIGAPPAVNQGTTGGLFGASIQAQQPAQPSTQTVPGVRIDVSNIRSTTRFNDLHEELQKEIENYDKGILVQQQRANDCSAIMPSHEEQLSYIPEGVEFLSRKLIGVETSLETDAESVAFVQNLIKSDIEDAKLSFKAIDNLKLPKQFHHPGIWSSKAPTLGPESQGSGAQDLVSFFSKAADEMDTKLSMYKSRVGEIEQHLRSVESATMIQAEQLAGNGPSADTGEQLRELGAVLREFEAGIMNVAGMVARTQDELEILKMGDFLTSEEDRRVQANSNGRRTGI